MKSFSLLHPIVIFLYFMTVIFITMFVSHPVILVVSLVCGIIFNLTLEKREDIVKNGLFYLGLFIIIAITNPLFSHNGVTPLFFMNDNPITLEAILAGISIATMLVSVLYWFKNYSIVMTSDKFLYLFGKISPKISLVFSMVIRFIPLFKTQIRKVSNAQTAMGLYTSDNYPDKFRSGNRVFSVMVTWALENAVETGDSMKSRGYELKNKSHYSLFRFTKRDTLFLVIIALLALVVVIGVFYGRLEFSFYPQITKIGNGLPSLVVYMAYCVLALLPFIVEIKEKLKWIYFRSQV